MRQSLENFVKSPLIDTLLRLGSERASIRFYETLEQESVEGNREMVKERFAVTYDERGREEDVLRGRADAAPGASRPYGRLVDLRRRSW